MRYRSYSQFSETAVLAIIAINLELFIAEFFYPQIYLNLGLRPDLWLERPWTILTSIFLHGYLGSDGGMSFSSIWHILFNMLALYFLGSYLNMIIGKRWFLGIYLVGGVIGSFLYIAMAPPNSIVVGASGAIFAVGGALAALVPNMKVVLLLIPVPMPLWVAIIGGFIIISFLPGVAWQAHLGGLITGLAAGYYLRKRGPRRIMF